MKPIFALALVILFGACTDYEDQVKDLRNHDIETDNNGWSEEKYTGDDADSKTEEETTSDSTNAAEAVMQNSEWSYKVTSISENNWGYQIFQKDKMLINQTTIPSVQGIDGFDSEEKAERTAEFILNKLENGTFPPTVNKEELEELKVLRD